MARRGEARLGLAWQGKARQGTVETNILVAGRGQAWLGAAWRGKARQGKELNTRQRKQRGTKL